MVFLHIRTHACKYHYVKKFYMYKFWVQFIYLYDYFLICHACIFSWQSPGTLILAGFRCGSLSASTVLCSSPLQIHGTVLSAVILGINPLLFVL